MKNIEETNRLTRMIIGKAIEVHRHLGPGLKELTYEEALCIEMDELKLDYERQLSVPVHYKGRRIGEYRLDLLIQGLVVVEIKSVERYDPLFQSQVLAYLKVTGCRVGLLINFNVAVLRNGIRRMIL